MSMRPKVAKPLVPPAELVQGPTDGRNLAAVLEAKRDAALAANSAPKFDSKSLKADIERLDPIEQAVVALDVDPDAPKPIQWLNEAHHEYLVKSNSLAPDLARRIEAHKYVTQRDMQSAAQV